MKKILLFNVCSIIMITSLFSQAMFVDEGNAYGFSGFYQSDEVEGGKTTTTSGMFSYLLNGNIELQVEYNMGYLTSDAGSDYDMTANGLGLGGWYHINNESLPCRVKVGGAYSSLTFDNDILSDAGITMIGTSTGFGGGIYKTVSETDSYSLTPFVNFSSVKSEVKMKDSSDSITTDDDFDSFSFGISIKMNNNYWVKPTISKVDGESSFSIGFGTYFLQK